MSLSRKRSLGDSKDLASVEGKTKYPRTANTQKMNSSNYVRKSQQMKSSNYARKTLMNVAEVPPSLQSLAEVPPSLPTSAISHIVSFLPQSTRKALLTSNFNASNELHLDLIHGIDWSMDEVHDMNLPRKDVWQVHGVRDQTDIKSMIHLKHLTFHKLFQEQLNPGELPPSLQRLTFGDKYEMPLAKGVLPRGLTHLIFGLHYNQPIDGVLCEGLTHLIFGNRFNQNINMSMLPASLKHLEFGRSFNCELNIALAPPLLTHLLFGNDFRQVIDLGLLPRTLHYLKVTNITGQFHPRLELRGLTFGKDFNYALPALPTSLQTLTFGAKFNRPIAKHVLPEGLMHLVFGAQYNQPISTEVLPSTLMSITLGPRFNHSLEKGVLPRSLTHITFGTPKCRINLQHRTISYDVW